MPKGSITVIGGGIAGLTASALLSHEGFAVTLLEAHNQLGGCAGTFRRGRYVFDVGATQVAGLEEGGIHQRLFSYLNIPLPKASILDPACFIDLGDGTRPICLCYSPEEWEEERTKQFPGSELFWTLCTALHDSNWSLVGKDPVLPIGNLWDFLQFIKAIRPANITSGFFSKLTIGDLLHLCGCNKDKRLRKFLDLQLKLYSQEPANRTAALYGATVLHMAQKPRGLWHLDGSMQSLSDALRDCFLRNNGNLMLGNRAKSLERCPKTNSWVVHIEKKGGEVTQVLSSDVIVTLPPKFLLELVSDKEGLSSTYRKRINTLPKSSGAIVFYGALARQFISFTCPAHFQLCDETLGSLFISISAEGDGRAPIGDATIIASAFTDTDYWLGLTSVIYQERKTLYMNRMVNALNSWLGISTPEWLHKELATPSSFQRWTGRPFGGVGGLGQHPSQFGPFGLPSRTPLEGLWLCGDSIYPGEGTAGVSQSAEMVCRQIMSSKGYPVKRFIRT